MVEGVSVALVTAKGSLGAATRETGQLLRRIVSIAVTAQHFLHVGPAEAEVVQKALVEIGEAVRGKSIAQRHAKGSAPCLEAGETCGKRPGRPINGKVEVKVEDPIVRAHGYFLSAGTRNCSRPRKSGQAMRAGG